jgi:hypothetical protein
MKRIGHNGGPPLDGRGLSRRRVLIGLTATAALGAPPFARATVGQGQRAAVVTAAAQPVIHLIAGQSNMIYGLTLNSATDLGKTEFFQMYSGTEGTANHISPGGANDPLDNPDSSGQTPTPAIGPNVHFYRDWYGPAFHPSKVLFLPSAYGGTSLLNTGATQWGVTAANAPSAVGSLTTNAITRIKLARQLWPTAKLNVFYDLVEGDMSGYSSFQAALLSHWRGSLHCWLLYMRQQMAAIGFANMPIVMGRPTPWALLTGGTAGGGTYYAPNMVAADTIMRGVVARLPYVGIADSMNPTQATYQSASQIHFDDAGQVTMAGRYWTAYQAAIANANFSTSPVWDSIDYLQTSLGYSAGYAVGSGGSTLNNDGTSGWRCALATCPSLPSTSAMLYAEMKATAVAASTYIEVGFCNQSFDIGPNNHLQTTTTNAVMADYSNAGAWTGGTGVYKGSTGSWTQGTAITLPTPAAGTVFQFALNRATGNAWLGVNGTWLGSGNPATGANPWVSNIPQTDMVFLAAALYQNTGNTLTIQGKASQFSYSPPSGFTAWGH